MFDADTGGYKRHWGAYGKTPSDAEKITVRRSTPPPTPLPSQFGNPVHCVRVARDGLVYVCDRLNNRIQVFQKDGRFVKEFSVEPQTAGNGSVWDLVLSPDPQQRWLFLADGRNNQVLTLRRDNGQVVAGLGRPAATQASFIGCTISPSTRPAIFTRAKWILENVCSDSAASPTIEVFRIHDNARSGLEHF